MKFILATLLFAFALALAYAGAQADVGASVEESTAVSDTVNDAGVYFEITGSDYANITIRSSEPVKLQAESIPEMITMMIEPISASALSTQITLSGLNPLTTYYKYQDNYHNLVEFITDENGDFFYTQDLTNPHFIFIQTRKSTKFLKDNATGGDCASIGDWDNTTKTCALTTDVHETIQIDSNNITLDGNGYTVLGAKTGFGVFFYRKTGLTIKNLIVRNFGGGIKSLYSVNNNLINNSALSNYNGIVLYHSDDNILSGNIAANNTGEGISILLSMNNILADNAMNGNAYNFRIVGLQNSSNTVYDSNTVDGKSIYFIKNAVNTVYDDSFSIGAFYCFDCDNITVKNLTFTKNGAGIYFWNTHNSRIENVDVSLNDYGIMLLSSNDNILVNNNMALNTNTAIRFYSSNNNLIYNNNFIDNNKRDDCDFFDICDGPQVLVSGSGNIFNNDSAGNYWSNFDEPAEGCNDVSSDGVCDAPYALTGRLNDNYPWTTKYGWLFAGNQPPVLSYSGEQGYMNDEISQGVEPNKGTTKSTKLIFKTIYTDDDNDAPENINIVISNGVTTITSPLILDANAAPELQDNDFTNGEQYTVTFTFPKGKYNYHFEASDGENTVRFPETGALGFETGYSNVAFLPGIKASRLYKSGENQLWEPNRNADVKALYLDENGDSSDVTIYTRDIIDESNILPTPQFNIYKKFIDFMDNDMVGGNIINEWKALPYDWRFDLNDILERGILSGGNIYYNSGATSSPYIIQEIKRLAKSSANGKVTIVTHSNGGLLAKALLQKLKDNNDELYYDIDRLIMAAPPQLGTPKAIEGLLHADEQQIGTWELGIFLDEEVARELVENMISAYHLLPSEKYFSRVASPVIEFKQSVSRIAELKHLAGQNITTADALYEFLLGSNGKRTEPKPDDEEYPNVLKAKLLSRAITTHNDILDSWQPPSHIEVIQIAGWGKDTIRGLKYKCGLLTCASLSSLDRELLFTSDGDGTVVSLSATAIATTTYYVDIKKYNKLGQFQRNRKHADIMEIESLQELIKSAVTQSIDNQNLPEYIKITKPEETESSLRLILKSPVSIDIYDSYGNHTGLIDNPDPESDLQLFEARIPNSYYIDASGHKYLGLDGRDEYQIDLTGLDLGTFTFEIQEVLNDEEINKNSFINIPVASGTKGMLTISETEVSEFSLDIDGDGDTDVVLTGNMEEDNISSLVIFRNIINDLDIHTGLKKKLISKLRQVEKDLKRGNINRAVRRLDGIIRHLEREITKNTRDEEKDKHHRHGHHYEKEKISTEDAEKLIEIIKKIQYNLI